MALNTVATYNYLVPADGTTHSVIFQADLSNGVASNIDWSGFSGQNFPFRPQGAKMVNNGSAPLVLTNPATGETNTCPAGASRWVSFTSTAAMQQQVSGVGNVKIVFVDYPVIETAPVNTGGLPISGASSLDALIAGDGLPTATALTTQDYYLSETTASAGSPAGTALTTQDYYLSEVTGSVGSPATRALTVQNAGISAKFASVAVGTTSGTLLTANPNLRVCIIQTGSEAININFGGDDATDSTFVIPANTTFQFPLAPTNGITAIAAVATTVLVITG